MSKQEEANLILKLYDLRREPVMREARNWFFTFNPTSAQDFIAVMIGDKSAYYRMVISYWEMAAALVNNGAIDAQMFNEANGEQMFVYSKVQPFLADLRRDFNMPDYLGQLEKLITSTPNIEERIAHMRERIKHFAALREQQTSKALAAEA